MLVVLYALMAACGLAGGWAAAVDHWIAVAASMVAATALACVISRQRTALLCNRASSLSPAHRAWFASALGCMVILLAAWGVFGQSLPSLSLDGVSLDPAGALGWTPQWLEPRLHVAVGLLAIGGVFVVLALGSWAWQKKKRKRPLVLTMWAAAPFFWMASLGLLAGVSEPWRQSVSHPLASQWKADLPPPELVKMAERALALSKTDPAAAVWAHALALRAYQENQFDRQRLDGYFHALATINANRHQSFVFPTSKVVGVERGRWCRTNLARDPAARANWSSSQKQCTGLSAGRQWNWPAH